MSTDSKLFTSHPMTAWIVCLSAGLFFFYEFFQLNIFDVINQALRQDFQIDAAQLSWLSSAYLWADILFLLPAGLLLDRFSTKKIIVSAMIICILGTFGFALTHSFYLAFFYHFLSGIGNAFCFLSCVVLVSRWFVQKRQALVIGIIVTMAFLGGMVAHTPFAYLANNLGWRRALMIDGALGLVLLMWIGRVVQDAPTPSSRPTATSSGHFWQAWSNRQTWLAGIYTSCLNLPIMVLCALWGASYLQIVHHLSSLTASNVISMILFGSIIGCPLVGGLSDFHGQRKPIMIIGAICTLLTLFPLFFSANLSVAQLNVLFFSLGLFTSTQVISYPFIAESNPSARVGSATGLASLLIMGGAGVGQVLFGYLMTYHAKHEHLYTISDFQFAMWIFPITAVLALLAICLTKESYCKRTLKEF